MNKILVPVLAAALGVAAVGCGSPKLTESQEYYVGRGVAANAMFDSKGTYVGLYDKDQGLEEYVALVGLSVALESDRPETFKGYHFGVVASNDERNCRSVEPHGGNSNSGYWCRRADPNRVRLPHRESGIPDGPCHSH